MKKLYYLIIFLFSLLFFVDGTAQSVIIGPGDYSSITYGPLRSSSTANQNGRYAYIYPASLLGAMEHGSTIRSVEFSRAGLNEMVGTVNFKIYLGSTSLEDWGSSTLPWDSALTQATLVYDANPTTAVGNSPGFKVFSFGTPFVYDTTNGKNLVVLTEYSQVEGQTSTINWSYDNSTGVPAYANYQTKYSYGTSLPASLASSNERHPQIKINFPLSNDAGIFSVSPSGLYYYPAGTTELPMTGMVINEGLNAATFTVTRTIYDGSSSVYTNTQNVTNLAYGETQEVAFIPFTGYVLGTEYTIKDSVFLTGDGNPLNDVMMTSFIPQIAKPAVFVFSSATTNERSNRDSTILALDTYGLIYDTLDRDNGLQDLSSWSTVIWSDESSVQDDERMKLMAFLNSGTELDEKSLIIAGDDIGFNHGRSGATMYDTVFYQQYLHAFYYLDDGNGTPDASRICGEIVNPGLCDSISSSYPDGIGALYGAQVAYRFADLPSNSDTVVAVVFDGPIYNVCYYAFEFREIVESVTDGVNQIMDGALVWVVAAGGTIPVELMTFNVSVNENNVTLNWATATETNNQGFTVERRYGDNEFRQIAFIKGKGTTTERVNYSYTDTKLAPGNYVYRLKQMDNDGSFTYSNEVNAVVELPKVYSLEQNYPNPFNPVTRIKYSVPVESFVNLAVYNILGEKVATLVQEIAKAGVYDVDFNASAFASGIYFYRLEAGDFISIKKMMLLK